jgi:hypothetical protein
MNFNFKSIFSEANGTPSSIRILLGIAVFAVVAAIAYLLVRHFLTGVMTDLPPNVSNLLTWLVSVLAGSKAASKFGEAPPDKSNAA